MDDGMTNDDGIRFYLHDFSCQKEAKIATLIWF